MVRRLLVTVCALLLLGLGSAAPGAVADESLSDVALVGLDDRACGARTLSPTDLTSTSVTLVGSLGTPFPGSGRVDAANCGPWAFDYGDTIKYGSSTTVGGPGSGLNLRVSASVSGLTPGTTYHFRV